MRKFGTLTIFNNKKKTVPSIIYPLHDPKRMRWYMLKLPENTIKKLYSLLSPHPPNSMSEKDN